MTFRNRLQYLLVWKLKISNKEALQIIFKNGVEINEKLIFQNCIIQPEDEVKLNNQLIKPAVIFETYAYYKPKGIETTFNTLIADNLKSILPFSDDFFVIGRLDKASEGLLLISNDGRLYDKILRNENKNEKEYLVKVNKAITADFLTKMAAGIKIMGKTTLPCKISKISEFEFKIILIQGLNRQIRRMCYKLDLDVVSLRRVRIGLINLGDLRPKEFRKVMWID